MASTRWIRLSVPYNDSPVVALGTLATMYQRGGITPLADEAETRANAEQALVTALGPTHFAAALARGAALSPVQAAEYALSVRRAPPEPPRSLILSLILKFPRSFSPAARNQGGGRFFVTMLSR